MQKPKKKKIIIAAICVLIALYGIHFFRCGYKFFINSEWERVTMGEYLHELLIPANPIDAVRLLPLYAQVNDAMSSTECTTKEEAAEKYGELSRYAFYDERTVNEKHFVSFLTGNIKGDTAYMWVRYSQEGYDSSGNRTSGSWGIEARISAKKQNGEWVVTGTREAP